MNSVIVVGAGPAGLWLACELRLAGVPTLVLERQAERSPNAKAMTVHARTIEVLAMRGLADRFLSAGRRLPDWHFGLLETRLDLGALDSAFPFLLAHSQIQTEEKLQERALELGAEIRRSHPVIGLQQDDDSATVQVAGPNGVHHRSASFVVGCDGAGSTVRRLAGIEFPGTDASFYGYLADVALDDPPPQPGFGRHGPYGSLVVVPQPGGRFRIFGYDAVHQQPGDLTFEQLRACSIRQVGTDFGMRDPSWLSRFGNATRVAATYRSGRVLLAGDAAHMHFPAGGVGLNVGVQDAMNLGWKLAAEVQGRAAPGLLDSYHEERHPVGAELARHTMAQTALMLQISPEGLELRALLNRLIASQPQLSLTLAEKLSAIDVGYPVAGTHRLVGARVPGPAGVFALLEKGKPILLNLCGAPLETATARAKAIGIETHPSRLAGSGRADWTGIGAVIVRPDGHVWWAGDDSADLEEQLIEGLAGLDATF